MYYLNQLQYLIKGYFALRDIRNLKVTDSNHSFVRDNIEQLISVANKKHKNCTKTVRGLVCEIFKEGLRKAPYQPLDYSKAKKIYQDNIALGARVDLHDDFYLGEWVTVVSNKYAWKEKKKFEQYGYGELCIHNFNPFTFYVDCSNRGYLSNHNAQEHEFYKTQVRIATEQEIQKEISKYHFILGEE